MQSQYSTNYVFLTKRRRRIQVRREICLLAVSALAAALIILSAAMLVSVSTQASELKSANDYKYYKSIQVEKGDTLWSIAAENIDPKHYKSLNEYISEIKSMNSIKTDYIAAGSYIIIPYFASGASAP